MSDTSLLRNRPDAGAGADSNVDAITAAAEVARDAATAVDDTDVTCTNCGNTESFGESEWCPRCGYHPRYEMVFDVNTGEWDDPASNVPTSLPPWIIVWGVGVVGIFVLGFVARLNFSVQQRAMWTLGQSLAGILVFCIAQVAAYTYAAAESDKYGPFDILFKPFQIWKPTYRDLPANAWRVWLFSWGITSTIVALVIVGGIDWMGLFEEDWGIKRSAKGNLVHHIVDQARREKAEAEGLEEALDEFAGEEEDEKPKKVVKRKADCLVFGVMEDAKGNPSQLLLASVYKKKLRYVGSIPIVHLPPEIREEMVGLIPLLKRGTPFVDCNVVGASWLHPVKLFRFEIDGWTSNGRIRNPVFFDMLENVRMD